MVAMVGALGKAVNMRIMNNMIIIGSMSRKLIGSLVARIEGRMQQGKASNMPLVPEYPPEDARHRTQVLGK